jgi:integrase
MKFDYLLEDEDVRRWHDNLSIIWGEVALRCLGRFTVDIGKSPKEFVSLTDKEMGDLSQDYILKLQRSKNARGKPYSPGYVDNVLTGIKSWSAFMERPIKRKIRIENADATPTLENERIPTVEETRKTLYSDLTDLRTRLSISFMAFSGCRPEVQGNYLGIDGLRIKDLPELEIKGRSVDFKKIPP